ncbi:MAG TPA: hypothetical protein VHT93_18520, partial [Pseudolabrys sp.]|nr:hypothetical protein [Pseudolabrys sp.]
MDFLRLALTHIKDWLSWLPNPVVAVLILALAVVLALAVHNWLRKLTRRLLATHYPNVFSIFTQMRGLTRLALLILAMIVALPVAPLGGDTSLLVARLLLIAIIGLVGWASITALHIAADIYLRRYRLDVDD